MSPPCDALHTLADANDVLCFLSDKPATPADDEWLLLGSEGWDDHLGKNDGDCRERGGGMIAFFKVEIDDVTNGARVILGFEPMRDGANAEGGMTGNAERMIGFLAPNWR